MPPLEANVFADEKKKNGPSGVFLFVVLLVLAAIAYIFRKRIAAWMGMGASAKKEGAAAGEEADAAPYAGPVSRVTYPEVTGKVIFEGGAHNEACGCSCSKLSASDFPVENRVGTSNCQVQVDPCDLVEGASLVDGSPKCHTVGSLCTSKLVPSAKSDQLFDHNFDLCVLQESVGSHCSWGCTQNSVDTYLASVTLPEGIQMTATSSDKCAGASVWQKACTTADGCKWSRDTYQDDDGMQFGVAPGYQITCKGKTIQGEPPSS